MSRTAVRAALKERLDRAIDLDSIAGLSTVYRAFPKQWPASAHTARSAPGQGWGVVLVINMTGSSESRVAGGDGFGWKRVDHDVVLQAFLLWRGHGDGQEATDALDGFLDDLKAWIRADRRAGAPADGSVIWQWGEAELVDRIGEPLVHTETVEISGAVRTQVTEFVPS